MPPTDDTLTLPCSSTTQVSGGPSAIMHSSASPTPPQSSGPPRVSGVKREHSSSPERRINAGGSAPSANSELQQHHNNSSNHSPTHMDPNEEVDDGEEDDDADDEDYAESDDPSHVEASQAADSTTGSDGQLPHHGSNSHDGLGSSIRPFGKKPRNKRRRVEDISEHEIWKCLFAPCTKIYKRTSTISIHNHRNSCRYRPLRANMITNPAAIHNIATANGVAAGGSVAGSMYASAVTPMDPGYYHPPASAYPHMTQTHVAAPADYYSHYAAMYAQPTSSAPVHHQVLPYPMMPTAAPAAAAAAAATARAHAAPPAPQSVLPAAYPSNAVTAASAAAAAAAAAAHMNTAFPSETEGTSEAGVKQAQAQVAAVQAQVELHHMQQRQAQQMQQVQQHAATAAPLPPGYAYPAADGVDVYHQQYAYHQQQIAQQRQQFMQHLPPHAPIPPTYHYMNPYSMPHVAQPGEALPYTYPYGIPQQTAPAGSSSYTTLPVAIPVAPSNPAAPSVAVTANGSSPLAAPVAATTTTMTTTTTTIHSATPVATSSTSPNVPPLSMNSPLSLAGGSTPMSLSTAVYSIGTPPMRPPQVMVRTASGVQSPGFGAAGVSTSSWSAFKSVNPSLLHKQGTSPINPALQSMPHLKAAVPLGATPTIHQPLLSSTPGEAAHEAWLEHMRSRVDGNDVKGGSSSAVKPTTPIEAKAETTTAVKSE